MHALIDVLLCIVSHINLSNRVPLLHPRVETLDGNALLQLDPAVPGVFGGPYPLGIDPVNPQHLFQQQQKRQDETFFSLSLWTRTCRLFC